MRDTASIMHLDLDAFFASVEQRDKPSLRGKPVIVGGLGPRGVVATASYEARQYGVRSAMRTAEARSRCPHGAYLAGRFSQYRLASRVVMSTLGQLSPLVQPLSLDEAFVDLQAMDGFDGTWNDETATAFAMDLSAQIRNFTGGLTASIGIASSKLMAKIASELNKPAGVFVMTPGTEVELLGPMSISVLPGVGPATTERLRRIGVHTVNDARKLSEDELMRALGTAAGRTTYRLAFARDDRPVTADREAKSISVEDTFATDITDRNVLGQTVSKMATKVAHRLATAGLSGRTVTIKFRYHDFETHTRSQTLAGPTDNCETINQLSRGLLAAIDVKGGLRLLGVGISGLADWVQDDLFDQDVAQAQLRVENIAEESAGSGHSTNELPKPTGRSTDTVREWVPGMDVHHRIHGDGWVWGSGLGRVTIRFETQHTCVGPVKTFNVDDPGLSARDNPGLSARDNPGLSARDNPGLSAGEEH